MKIPKPQFSIDQEVKLKITLEITAVVAEEPEWDEEEGKYLYTLAEFGYSPASEDIYLSEDAEGFELFDGEASIFRENELSIA